MHYHADAGVWDRGGQGAGGVFEGGKGGGNNGVRQYQRRRNFCLSEGALPWICKAGGEKSGSRMGFCLGDRQKAAGSGKRGLHHSSAGRARMGTDRKSCIYGYPRTLPGRRAGDHASCAGNGRIRNRRAHRRNESRPYGQYRVVSKGAGGIHLKRMVYGLCRLISGSGNRIYLGSKI